MIDAKILRKLSPQEWRERDRRSLAAIMATGTSQPSEKEFFRRDGSRVPVLVGGAAFGGRGREGVAFVVDLTERKRVEALARENEQRYRLELEHANRVAMMGQLSASVAHEVNQPIAAIFTSAETALRSLGASRRISTGRSKGFTVSSIAAGGPARSSAASALSSRRDPHGVIVSG